MDVVAVTAALWGVGGVSLTSGATCSASSASTTTSATIIISAASASSGRIISAFLIFSSSSGGHCSDLCRLVLRIKGWECLVGAGSHGDGGEVDLFGGLVDFVGCLEDVSVGFFCEI